MGRAFRLLVWALAIPVSLLGMIRQSHADDLSKTWSAGSAKVSITPDGPIWMAGYAARKGPSEGSRHPLWAKALVLRDPAGNLATLVTLDICGIDRKLSLEIRESLCKRFGLDMAGIVLACSHTHSGPVVGTNLITMYPLDETQLTILKQYSETLKARIVESVEKAFSAIKPATLSYDVGRCGFATNRRNNDQGRVPELRSKIDLLGPDDHDVPVLRVTDSTGAFQSIVVGYACHCTTLDDNQLNGDYAGYAQIAIEKANPGAIALFWAGCGADQNPLPRRTVELAERYGQELATAVQEVVRRPMRAVSGSLRTAYEEIPLEFAPFPDRAGWEERARSQDRFEAARARFLLERWDQEGGLSQTYPYPVQMWKLGDQLNWIFLGGEVVVDYSLRLKRNLGADRTWVTAYSNDVMAYIPSLRILKEGGYEGGAAMVYYAQPGPWSERVEDQVIDGIRLLLKRFVLGE